MLTVGSAPLFQTKKFSSADLPPGATLTLSRHPQQGVQAIISDPSRTLQPDSVEISGVDLQKLKAGHLPLSIFHTFSIRVVRLSDGTLTVRLMPTLLGGGGCVSKSAPSSLPRTLQAAQRLQEPHFTHSVPLLNLNPAALFPLHNTKELAVALKTLSPEDPRYRPFEQLALAILEGFAKTQHTTPALIEEACSLAASGHSLICRGLLKIFIKKIRDEALLEDEILKALNFTLRFAPLELLDADDLVQMLKIVSQRMENLHYQRRDIPKITDLLRSLAEILDFMGDANVFNLDRISLHAPLYKILDSLADEEELAFHAAYAKQALVRVPPNESKLGSRLRRGMAAARTVAHLAQAVWRQELSPLQEAYTAFKEAAHSQENQHLWYEEMRFLKLLFELGHFVEFEKFLRTHVQQPLHTHVTAGISLLLYELALEHPDLKIRKQAVDFLLSLFLEDTKGGDKKQVKKEILKQLIELAKNPSEPLRSHVRDALALLPAQAETKQQQQLIGVLLPEDITSIPISVNRHPPVPFSTELFTAAERVGVLTLPQKIERLRQATLKDDDLRKDLNLYIPVLAKDDPFSKTSSTFDLEPRLDQFLNGNKSVFLLLGDSGGGKSTFCRYIEHNLWKSWKEGDPLPLFISLPALKQPFHEAVEETLRSKGFTEHEIQKLKQDHVFLFIFDGYDEISKRKNLYESNQLKTWRAKTIITCRIQYLLGDQNTYRSFFIPSDPNLLEEATVVSFEPKQIDAYLQKYTSVEKTKWPWQEYRKVIDSIADLAEMIENPFVLRLTVEVLPDIIAQHTSTKKTEKLRLTRIGLYDAFTKAWFERSERRLIGADFEGGFDIKQAFLDYCTHLAAQMLNENVVAINYQERLNLFGPSLPSLWEPFFTTKRAAVVQVREGVPLRKLGPTTYAFLHKSLLEYFGARAVFEQARASFTPTRPHDPLEIEEKEDSTSRPKEPARYLQTRLMTEEPAVLRFLADYVTMDPVFEQSLFTLIERSKKNKALATGAANAITILNLARISFHGRDFRNISIPGANLSYALLDSTDFSGSDLSNVVLKQAYLARTNLSSCNLEGIELGQLPYLEHDARGVQLMVISPDGKYLYACCKNEYMSGSSVWLWDLTKKEVRRLEEFTKQVVFFPDDKVAFTHENKYDIDSIASIVLMSDLDSRKELLSLKFPLQERCSTVLLSPDERFALVCDEKGTARVWDLGSKKELKNLKIVSLRYKVCTLSSGGKLVFSDGKDISIWNLDSGKELGCLKGHTASVSCLAVSPDGKLLLSGHTDGSIQVWDLDSGKELGCLKGHTASVSCLAVSPDGKLLLSGDADGSIQVWDLDSEKELGCLKGHTASIRCLAVSPDGNLAVSSDNNTVRLWDLSCGEELWNLEEKYIYTITFSYDEKLVFKNGGSLELYDLASGEKVLSLEEPYRSCIQECAFSPDGKLAVFKEGNGSIRMWDLVSRKELYCLEERIKAVCCIAFSSDGKLAFSGGSYGFVQLWDLISGEELWCLEVHKHKVSTVDFSPDGKLALAESDDGAVHVWELVSKEEIFRLKEKRGIKKVGFSPDGNCVFLLNRCDDFWIWDLVSGENLYRSQESLGAFAFSPDGKLAFSEKNGCVIRLLEINSKKELEYLEGHEGIVTSVAFSPDGKWALSGSEDQTVRLWDLTSKKENQCLKAHRESIKTVAFSPDGKFAFSGSEDSTIQIWNLDNLKMKPELPFEKIPRQQNILLKDKMVTFLQNEKKMCLWDLTSGKKLHYFIGHTAEVNICEGSPDRKLIVSGSEDSTIRIWDPNSGKELYCLEGHRGGVVDVVFSPDNKWVVSRGRDQTVRLWDLSSDKKLYCLKEGISRALPLSFSPDGRFILLIDGNRPVNICVWDLTSKKEICQLKEEINSAFIRVELSTDGKLAIWQSYFGSDAIRIVDLATGKENFWSQESERCSLFAFSPDGKVALFKYGTFTNTVSLVDLNSEKELHSLKMRNGVLVYACFSPDGKLVLATGKKEIMIWDLVSGKELYYLEGHTRGVTYVTFSPDGKWALSSSDDQTIRLWDLISGKELGCLKGHTHSTLAEFSSDGKKVFSFDDEGVKTWTLFDTAGRFRPMLTASFSLPTLCCDSLNIENAKGLSSSNKTLFLQQGALFEGKKVEAEEEKEQHG